ncbi:hypothetical protein QWI17_19900 [Gilvimarinus sp. SDUM040013]|uniref:Uncharacterized protein n=1 Tax=Gilvimarinus gilvus TaxID=3058038 RepID=A0ABU4RZJ8_9GAMM|nr:hypothetical protein [Gilvimarinus sp. SDUM040013]MDO3388119.1 hypothetical protein [Gilvimarinus sp. SDUM040013]MDX6850306.1 hypothetical protein [Gilvimarinus sp. SDUM040013]
MTLTMSNSLTDFPFPEWSESLIDCIDSAFKVAWNKATASIDEEHTELENHLTNLLEYELHRMLDTENAIGFNRGRFQSPVRGAECCDYQNKSISKKPDLTIRLLDMRPGISDVRQDAMFVECKVLDVDKRPLAYIENGIRRFVDGEYAWAMPHALMLGYVLDKSVLPGALVQCFNRNKQKPLVARCAPSDGALVTVATTQRPITFRSSHPRKWAHLEYGAPGPIQIYHVWLHSANK